MANLYNEHHDGMTQHGSDTSREIDGVTRELVQKYATRENIFELESILFSSVGAACAEFRIINGLNRRQSERVHKEE